MVMSCAQRAVTFVISPRGRSRRRRPRRRGSGRGPPGSATSGIGAGAVKRDEPEVRGDRAVHGEQRDVVAIDDLCVAGRRDPLELVVTALGLEAGRHQRRLLGLVGQSRTATFDAVLPGSPGFLVAITCQDGQHQARPDEHAAALDLAVHEHLAPEGLRPWQEVAQLVDLDGGVGIRQRILREGHAAGPEREDEGLQMTVGPQLLDPELGAVTTERRGGPIEFRSGQRLRLAGRGRQRFDGRRGLVGKLRDRVDDGPGVHPRTPCRWSATATRPSVQTPSRGWHLAVSAPSRRRLGPGSIGRPRGQARTPPRRWRDAGVTAPR